MRIEICSTKHGNKCVYIDDEDYNKVSMYHWSINKKGKYFYIETKINNKSVYLHRLLLDAKQNQIVDHMNGDTFDNRKNNLRICSIKENVRNSKIRSNNTSGYKGVVFDKDLNKWRAQITVDRRCIYLGSFLTKEEAYKSYCKATKKYHGKFGRVK